MEEKDDNLKNWMITAFEDASVSANFTDNVMELVDKTPKLETKPLINKRIWRYLIFILVGLLAMIIGASFEFGGTIQLPTPSITWSTFIIDNWLVFSCLLMTSVLILADEFWRRKRNNKHVIL